MAGTGWGFAAPRRGGHERGRIHVGVGGWTFPPWRGVFYPRGCRKRRSCPMRGASDRHRGQRHYCRLQSPESFAKWHDEVPEGFVFA